MAKDDVNTYNNHLIATLFLGFGIVSVLLLISNHLNYAYSESYYIIKSKLNDLVLDIRASSPIPGAFVQTWTQNNGLNQQWILEEFPESTSNTSSNVPN